ncbi:uncharacterized protein LAJ45_02440 [Morchella importuna]|uniref:uncharacterized protein n=1 Tax=Morchella importuna TaxID=1174673 RepID=UPI001E8D5880|nr:uncharacterized protein LAJ45_02440 [Morchella importuna]KAH8153627.1 hypothetical protein LAJ45_02440 [Morchella importuna]
MTAMPGSEEILEGLGSSSCNISKSGGSPINTTTKAQHIQSTGTIPYEPQPNLAPQNRESSVSSGLIPETDKNTTNSHNQPSQLGVPDGNIRGRDRVVRKGERASSSGSDNSSKNREAREKAVKAAEEAEERGAEVLAQYRKNGDSRELAKLARDKGIPPNLRREIWPILLNNHPCVLDKHIAKEFVERTENHEDTREIPFKRIRRELERYHRKLKKVPATRNGSPSSNPSPVGYALPNGEFKEPEPGLLDQAALDTAVEDAVVAFLENHDHVNYAPGMVYVCLTLADWLFMPPSVAANNGIDYFNDADILSSCFEKMMYVILWSPTVCSTPIEPSDSVINQRISHFLTTFRQLLPEVARYFDEEEVASFGEQWVCTWIQWWCAGELRKDEKGRLWDWYLGFEQPCLRSSQQSRNKAVRGEFEDSRGSHPDEIYYPSDWHILVCVALLKSRKDDLEELEQSEIRTLLRGLPKVDMGLIIEEAKSLREELRAILQHEEEDYANRSTGNASDD